MLNKHGGKVRLTFKLESDQLWLSTKERTEKLPMGSIKNIVSEPIADHEEYHIVVKSIYSYFLSIEKFEVEKLNFIKKFLLIQCVAVVQEVLVFCTLYLRVFWII